MKKNTVLITIDPQNDFGDRRGSLFVPGADNDMARLAKLIQNNQSRITDIHVTMDSHQLIHIAHPIYWIDSKGVNHPNPFTQITAADVTNGVWRAFNPRWQSRSQEYVNKLTTNNRYPLIIWPPHCLIGSWGHSLVPVISEALINWERDTFNRVNFVAKGSNLFTEHYSAVQADVPDDSDPSTKLNTTLIDAIAEPSIDEIITTGEALSHCVANTLTDIADTFGDDNIKKLTLLLDTTSNVPGFEKQGQEFVAKMVKRGMKTTTTKDW